LAESWPQQPFAAHQGQGQNASSQHTPYGAKEQGGELLFPVLLELLTQLKLLPINFRYQLTLLLCQCHPIKGRRNVGLDLSDGCI
jgi:hypothetical protein